MVALAEWETVYFLDFNDDDVDDNDNEENDAKDTGVQRRERVSFH